MLRSALLLIATLALLHKVTTQTTTTPIVDCSSGSTICNDKVFKDQLGNPQTWGKCYQSGTGQTSFFVCGIILRETKTLSHDPPSSKCTKMDPEYEKAVKYCKDLDDEHKGEKTLDYNGQNKYKVTLLDTYICNPKGKAHTKYVTCYFAGVKKDERRTDRQKKT